MAALLAGGDRRNFAPLRCAGRRRDDGDAVAAFGGGDYPAVIQPQDSVRAAVGGERNGLDPVHRRYIENIDGFPAIGDDRSESAIGRYGDLVRLAAGFPSCAFLAALQVDEAEAVLALVSDQQGSGNRVRCGGVICAEAGGKQEYCRTETREFLDHGSTFADNLSRITANYPFSIPDFGVDVIQATICDGAYDRIGIF